MTAAPTGPLGVTLPAAVMVGRALGWRVTAEIAVANAVFAVAAGGLLTLLS